MACGVLAFLELLQVLSPERNLACQPVERISCESLAGRPQGLHVSSGIGTESSNQHRTVLEAAAHKPAGEAGQRMNSVSRSGRRANSQPLRTTLQLQRLLSLLCELQPTFFMHARCSEASCIMPPDNAIQDPLVLRNFGRLELGYIEIDFQVNNTT